MCHLPIVRETKSFRSFFLIDTESNNVSADSSFEKPNTNHINNTQNRSFSEAVDDLNENDEWWVRENVQISLIKNNW